MLHDAVYICNSKKDVIGKLNLLIIEIHWKHATANVWQKHKWATTAPYME
jgi:hypothetical protein